MKKKYIDVYVSKTDIKRGVRNSSCSCPIALSIKRKMKHHVVVGNCWARVDNVTYRLPRKAKIFVTNFDARDEVEPFSFRMYLNKY